MNEAKRKVNIPVLTAITLLFLTLLTLNLTCKLYARYTTQTENNDAARVAAFVLDVTCEDGFAIDLSDISKPGDKAEYSFTVTNKSGSAISEVAECYELIAQLTGNLPLQVSILDAEENVLADTDETGVTEAAPVVSSSPYGGESVSATTLSASVESAHTYVVSVVWPADRNQYLSREDGYSMLTLNVHGRQVD